MERLFGQIRRSSGPRTSFLQAEAVVGAVAAAVAAAAKAEQLARGFEDQPQGGSRYADELLPIAERVIHVDLRLSSVSILIRTGTEIKTGVLLMTTRDHPIPKATTDKG